MLDLMPKISENMEQIGGIEEYIKKYRKVEIQYFPRESKPHYIDYETAVKYVVENFDVKEVTLHTPLNFFDIEWVLLCNETVFFDEIRRCIEISEKYNIDVNFLYHSNWNIFQHRAATFDKLKKALKMLEGTRVTFLVENLIVLSEERNETTALKLCEEIDHPNLRMCFDICHMYTQSHMYDVQAVDWFEAKLKKELCEKYVKQVHFSFTSNYDGYKDKKTHGIGHFTKESVEYDLCMLEKFGMKDKTIVTEIAEENYSFRGRQLKDIAWLEEIFE